MNPKQDNQKNDNRRHIIIFAVIMIVVLLVNISLTRMLTAETVKEVPYSTFLQLLNSGLIKEVEVENRPRADYQTSTS